MFAPAQATHRMRVGALKEPADLDFHRATDGRAQVTLPASTLAGARDNSISQAPQVGKRARETMQPVVPVGLDTLRLVVEV